ncbi:MAG TPA: hypothetical protein ENH00_13215 [Actinobacteria bacterium]|nr:hypothetical protein [Actinomycetota bacterium]
MFTIDTSNVGACERLAGDLDDVASPVVLMGLAERVPDGVTSELFVDDLAAKLRLLGVCGTGNSGGVGATVAFQSELLERRLTELGVSW